MADVLTLNGKVVLDSKGAEVPLRNIKKELKDAQLELITINKIFGETSQQAIDCAKKIATLKDEIGDAKALTEAFSPDKKFQAFSQAINGVVGGFTALQGAVGLFGAESENLQKTLVKVQSALALSQGLSAITESFDAFKNLKQVVGEYTIVQRVLNYVNEGAFVTNKQLQASQVELATTTETSVAVKESEVAVTETSVAVKESEVAVTEAVVGAKSSEATTTEAVIGAKESDIVATEGQVVAQETLAVATATTSTAMKVLRAVLISTGIGALVVAIGSIIGAIIQWTDSTDEQKKAQEELNNELEREKELLDSNLQDIDYVTKLKIANAKLQGKSVEELRKLESDAHDQKLKEYNDALDRNINAQRKIDTNTKEGAELYKKYTQESSKISKQINDEIRNYQLKTLDDQVTDYENANKKKEESDKNKLSKSKENQQKLSELEKSYNNERRNLLTENTLAEIKDEEKKAKTKAIIDFENERKRINDSEYNATQRKELLKQIEIKYQNEIDKIEEEANKKRETQNKITDDLITKNRIQSIKDEFARKQFELSVQEQKEIDDLIALLEKKEITQVQYEERLKLIKQNYQIQQDKLVADKQQERLNAQAEADLKGTDDVALSYDQKLKLIEDREKLINKIVFKSEAERTAFEKANKDARIKIAIAEKERKAQITGQIGDIATGLMTLIAKTNEKNKDLQIASLIVEQASAVAKIIANTSVANAKAIAQFPETGGMPYVALNTISAGIGIATSVQSVVKGIQEIKNSDNQQSPSGAGSTGLTAPSGTSATPPLAPQLETTTLNQAQINQLSSATTRAFVLESDVTTNQERIIRLNRASRIN